MNTVLRWLRAALSYVREVIMPHSRSPKAPPASPTRQFDPKARYALQLEFEAKDRAILLRIANAHERIASALMRIAAAPPRATDVRLAGLSVSEPPTPTPESVPHLRPPPTP